MNLPDRLTVLAEWLREHPDLPEPSGIAHGDAAWHLRHDDDAARRVLAAFSGEWEEQVIAEAVVFSQPAPWGLASVYVARYSHPVSPVERDWRELLAVTR